MTELKQGFTPDVLVDDMSALLYIIKTQIENRVNTIDIVRVIGVNEDDTINVIPIIKNTDNENAPIEETPIFRIRYIKWQFGVNSIKATPAVGDVGLALVCKKDMSSIAAGIVGNKSKYNTANSIYLGGLNGLNVVPTQFIEFKENEITITGTGTININATDVNVTATNSTITATNINLGGEGGAGIAKVGSKVTNNGQPDGATVGFIAEGSTVTKSL